MGRTLLTLQILAMMCTPIPQIAYVAVGIGRTAGFSVGSLLLLYAIANLLSFNVVFWLAHFLGRPGLARLAGRFDRWPRLLRPRRTAPRVVRGPVAMYALGYVNLYLAAVMAAFRRDRRALAVVLGMAGDLTQFSLAVVLATQIARLVPGPAATSTWIGLLIAPPLLAVTPLLWRPIRRYLPKLLGWEQPRRGAIMVSTPARPE